VEYDLEQQLQVLPIFKNYYLCLNNYSFLYLKGFWGFGSDTVTLMRIFVQLRIAPGFSTARAERAGGPRVQPYAGDDNAKAEIGRDRQRVRRDRPRLHGHVGLLRGSRIAAESVATIHAALEVRSHPHRRGDFYGGHNEMLIAEALKGRPRDGFVLSVKFGALRDPAMGSSLDAA
jgi:hypothetical protein